MQSACVAIDNLKKALAKKLRGVGEDRIAVRTQGCWNCVNADYEKAKNLWWTAMRATWLQKAVNISLQSPKGEDERRVRVLRQMTADMDVSIEQNGWICCSVGVKPTQANPNVEEPVADLVPANFLCRKWTAKQGASVAREGAGPDKLPEEIFEDFNRDGKID